MKYTAPNAIEEIQRCSSESGKKEYEQILNCTASPDDRMKKYKELLKVSKNVLH